MMKSQIEIFDTTLRDGSQGEDVSLSLEDKLVIAERLDRMGFHYIEGGWPAPGNEKDQAFFKRAAKLRFKNSVLVAFGSTQRPGHPASKDPLLLALIEAQTKVVCIFGKSWDIHATKILKVSLAENLKLITDSVGFLKSKKRRVFYDAEHFFDGYKANPKYALETITAAYQAGAERLVLCDTNGGCLPSEVAKITAAVREALPQAVLGIHAHNDGEMAVANSLAAVQAGAVQVQGTVNGYGERCGNANLLSVIPNLRFKLSLNSIPEKNISLLTELSRFVSTVTNVALSDHQPFVGMSAFAHKAGVHVDAVMKSKESYEHMAPEKIGNIRRLLVSDQAGKATVIAKAANYGVKLDKSSPQTKAIILKVKQMELAGYQFEGADASFAIMLKKLMGKHKPSFDLESYHVKVDHRGDTLDASEATIKLRVKGKRKYTVAEGNGPVNALDSALRQALLEFYPQLADTELIDYKVRVLTNRDGTASKVRVVMESTDGKHTWATVGVHENVIEASWEALVDSMDYRLTLGKKG